MMNKNKISIILVIFLLTSCAPKSKTLNPITHSEKSNIKNLAVYVDFEDYKFKYKGNDNAFANYSPSSCPGGGLGGAAACLILLLVESTIVIVGTKIDDTRRKKTDKKQKNVMQASIEVYNPNHRFTSKLQNKLRSSIRNSNIEVADNNSYKILINKGFDAILEVKLQEWNMEDCYPTNPNPRRDKLVAEYQKYINDKIQEHKLENMKKGRQTRLHDGAIAMKVRNKYKQEIIEKGFVFDMLQYYLKMEAKIVDLNKKQSIWERREVVKNDCDLFLNDLRTKPDVILDLFSDAINELSVNTIRELKLAN